VGEGGESPGRLLAFLGCLPDVAGAQFGGPGQRVLTIVGGQQVGRAEGRPHCVVQCNVVH